MRANMFIPKNRSAWTLVKLRRRVTFAEERDLQLACAPCSALSETAQTVWKAVKDGVVGKVGNLEIVSTFEPIQSVPPR
jgi:hypothetical protein